MIQTIYRHFTRRLGLAGATLACAAVVALTVWSQELNQASSSEEILKHVKYLASDELTGRGVGTPGIKLARDYIAGEFAKYNLTPGGDSSSYLQSLEVPVGVTVKQPSQLALSGRALVLDNDWTPLGLSGNGEIEASLVFAGYGITAKEYGYDDYEGIDAKGKVVVVLRYEPPPQDSKSPFRKPPSYSSHAALRTKANNARAHGAAAMILVDLDHRDGDKDQLMTTTGSLARNSANNLLAVQVKSSVMEKFLELQGVHLGTLKTQIDQEGKSASMPVGDARVKLQVTLQEIRERTENVIGILPGADPELARQDIVIGAHYDHLGFGHFGALSAKNAGQIHHGADDNASGTAVLLDLAQRLSRLPVKPARTIVFVAFSGEELGLFGSRQFVERFPKIAATRAMLNLDMVGRLRDNRLTVFGARSGDRLGDLITAGASNLGLVLRHSDDVGRSDHMSFYNKKIPVLHLSTGVHQDYHRPSDTWEKLNIDGMAQISDLTLLTIIELANAKEPLQFVALPARSPSERAAPSGAIGVYLGTMPDYGADSAGVRLAGVANDSPAARAGLREGDIIIKLAGAEIMNIEDLTDVLSSRKPGDEIEIVIMRMNQPLTLKATLQSRS
jgi:aminopeptidase YwaD